MSIFLFCDDNVSTRNEFQKNWYSNIQRVLDGLSLEFADSKSDALNKIANITDKDVVSLDSRMPSAEDGEEILIALRRRGCKCLVLWHSPTNVPRWATTHCFKFSSWNVTTIKAHLSDWGAKCNTVDCSPPPDCQHAKHLHELVAKLSVLKLVPEASDERETIEKKLHAWWDKQPIVWRKELMKFLTDQSDAVQTAWAASLSNWCNGQDAPDLQDALYKIARGCL